MTIDLDPVKVIDADTHLTERHDLWTSRAPAGMKDRRPHVAEVGEDNIMFETDFPYPTCLYPDPLGVATENIRDLTATARDKILGGNATKLYGL